MPRRKSDSNPSLHIPFYVQRIRDLREDQDKTQAQIAELLHVSQRIYSDYERGIVRIPLELMIQLARYYDVDMNYICGITRNRSKFPGK